MSMSASDALAPNGIYAQAGGVTAVINTSAAGLIAGWQAHAPAGSRLLAARDGLLGLLAGQLHDIGGLDAEMRQRLQQTPSAAFGSCRHVLRADEEAALVARLRAHDIGHFFYNGGGGAARACQNVLAAAQRHGYALNVVHIPKTIDNDLPGTDCCPGFGSAAKYLATSIHEAGLDLAAMAGSSSKVFILETMGRYSGWLTAACGLAARYPGAGPHLLLLPEKPFVAADFVQRVRETVQQYGHCVVAAAEGLTGADGQPLHSTGAADEAGDRQLGGVAPWLAALLSRELGYKCHWAVADYLQRSARHLASATDLAQAYACAEVAAQRVWAGERQFSAVVARLSAQPYVWEIRTTDLQTVAGPERRVPAAFLSADGYSLSAEGRACLQPLIAGEAWPTFAADGLPAYAPLALPLLASN